MVLIGDKPIALQPDRRIANAADAQLTGKPPQLGLGNDPEYDAEKAPRSASASGGYGADRLCHRSSETIVAR